MSMFARKPKSSSDVVNSVQRFADLHRDSVSRVKHLKILLDSLTIHEKRQLIDDYSFETFHLVDELLLTSDVAANPQGAIEAESGLWTLEQVLCLAPELVGNGWQRHAIESLLKKAIYPHNLLAVRKIAIRLFLLFYQSLAVFGKATPELDRVFQCLLPYFPLQSGESTELILQEYCQSAGKVDHLAGTLHWSRGGGGGQGAVLQAGTQHHSPKERAQMLQVYLDKFLEYCTRESTRIEWNDEGRRLECASFIIHKIIDLYIMETFPDLETNGVDIFGGWEGADDASEPLDTADPVVIARYWLIRWMNNVAGATQQPSGTVHNGLLLFHKALFASQKATNTLLSLMREAMVLPLPCSNVIHKVVYVLSRWLLQYELPPFVASGQVPVESSSLLLIHIMMSFFQSPYLLSAGDRSQSAVSISFSILRSCRDLVAIRNPLPRPLSTRVWTELLLRLCDSGGRVCAHSDRYSQDTAAAFANTVLTCMVLVKAVRRVEVDERLWDEVAAMFATGIWPAMGQQWAKVARAVTRALILHIRHVDIFANEKDKPEEERAKRAGGPPSVAPPTTAGEMGTVQSGMSADTAPAVMERAGERDDDEAAAEEDALLLHADLISTTVSPSHTGDPTVWLLVWKRVFSLIGPASQANSLVFVETCSWAMGELQSNGLHNMAQWLAQRMLQSAHPSVVPHCVPALCTLLGGQGDSAPPLLLQAHVLDAVVQVLQSGEQSVLPHLTRLPPRHLQVLAPHILSMLGSSRQPGWELLRLVALLAPQHKQAEQFVLSQLSSPPAELPLSQCMLCVNALCLLIVRRADVELMMRVLSSLRQHPLASRLLPVFCAAVLSLARFGLASSVLQVLISAAGAVSDERVRTEMEWWMSSVCVDGGGGEQWPQVLHGVVVDGHRLLLGALVSLHNQFPLPSLSIAQWNSQEVGGANGGGASGKAGKMAFVEKKSAIISMDPGRECEWTSRTAVGRRTWQVEAHPAEKRDRRHVSSWLRKEAARGRRAGRDSVGILGAMEDPFDALPRSEHNKERKDVSEWVDMIEASRRQPAPSRVMGLPDIKPTSARVLEWRSLAAACGMLDSAAEVPDKFHRDLRHLDNTNSRETHKVALIYVGAGQQDKQSILSNATASPQFDGFVCELGWEVRIGRGHDGYHGGLPPDSIAPYYATPDTEVIFHVSTWLGGDVTHKIRHIGNDEIHIVWSEDARPYKRDVIATKFCDVLIVLERAEEGEYRVRVEQQNEALAFGPLYDGSVVGEAELAELVRQTAVNASRAYRMAREEHARPLRHREHVFSSDTKRHMQKVQLADAVNAIFAPTMC